MWAQEGKGDVKPVLLRFVEVEERKVVRSWERQQGGAAERLRSQQCSIMPKSEVNKAQSEGRACQG